MAQRLATILSSSRYLVDLLKRAPPETMQLLTDTDALHPKSSVQLVAEMRTASRVKNTLEDQVLAIRAIRRRELFRIGGAGDLLGGELDLATVGGESLTQVTQATLDATLQVVTVHEREVRGGDLIPPTVIAMGRWGGGRELSYSSDADALFVLAEGGRREIRDATAVIKTLRSVLSRPGPEPGAGPGRRSAAGGQGRADGADPRLLPDLLPAVVGDMGGAGPGAGRLRRRGIICWRRICWPVWMRCGGPRAG